MKVEVRFFASLADRAGTSSEAVDLAPGTDVLGLWRQLVERHPAFSDLSYRPRAACDLELVDWEHELDGVREVAFLPPVSGG